MSDQGDRWVVLDVGETIIEESRIWSTWADELGIPRMTLMCAIGAVIERGGQYGDVLDYFAVDGWRTRREAVQAKVGSLRPEDLYPDALTGIAGLRQRGYRVAVLGNQPAGRTEQLRAIGVDPEVMAMSDEMGVAKPDPAFFADTLARLGDPSPKDVAYVGDRIDNDVQPSATAGMRAVWIRRGPWGVIPREAPREAVLVVDSLTELTERIDEAFV
jgi:FMN phosphatase YigB (HAD superfamily)